MLPLQGKRLNSCLEGAVSPAARLRGQSVSRLRRQERVAAALAFVL